MTTETETDTSSIADPETGTGTDIETGTETGEDGRKANGSHPDGLQPDAAPEAPAGPDPVEALQRENADLKDKVLRTLAEAENVRKRAERQVADERVYAVEKFARDMLSVADNLARALSALDDEARAALSEAGTSLLAGIEMTERDLIAALQRHGVTPVEASPGTPFDPNVHQAIQQVASGEPEGCVAEPFQSGWKIGERTLRAAMVTVSTGPAS